MYNNKTSHTFSYTDHNGTSNWRRNELMTSQHPCINFFNSKSIPVSITRSRENAGYSIPALPGSTSLHNDIHKYSSNQPQTLTPTLPLPGAPIKPNMWESNQGYPYHYPANENPGSMSVSHNYNFSGDGSYRSMETRSYNHHLPESCSFSYPDNSSTSSICKQFDAYGWINRNTHHQGNQPQPGESWWQVVVKRSFKLDTLKNIQKKWNFFFNWHHLNLYLKN